MKVLVTIPHCYNPQGKGSYASVGRDPQPRVTALTECLRALRTHYDTAQVWFRYTDRLHVLAANEARAIALHVVICTSGDLHLLERLPIPGRAYQHRATDCEPMFLGFECHTVLKENLGNYDYYCYLEDDLILHDPLFFQKLVWFNERAGNAYLLQPNRYEKAIAKGIEKNYIDLDLFTERNRPNAHLYQQTIEGQVLGATVRFGRTSNPHAGCFFLNQEQMRHWTNQPHFLSRDTSFFGPLESAATLGIRRTFQIYKPLRENASFLEIQHFGEMWSQKIYQTKFW